MEPIHYNFQGSELLRIQNVKISHHEGQGRPYEKFKGELISTNGEKRFFPVYGPTIPETKQYIRADLKSEANGKIIELHVEDHDLKIGDKRKQGIKRDIESLLNLDSRLVEGVLKEVSGKTQTLKTNEGGK